jgi:ADP-dependent NAD(P)H-hydrate dehydratase
MSDDGTAVTSATLRDWPLPEPDDGAGKDARGTVLVIGGATDTPGAAMLAGLAALRVGAGKLTIGTVDTTAAAMAVAVPEAGVQGLPAGRSGSLGADAVEHLLELVAGADAIVLGPGMRGPDDTKALVAGVLPHVRDDAVVVIDAMALTCGAVDSEAFRGLGQPAVVTPNVKEARLLGADDVDDVGADAAAALAKQLRAVVALHSTVASPDGEVWRDGSGDAGLGTSGSGDVLAGAIAGLAARGASPTQATVWGVHLHAEAGERLASRVGRLGFLARELLDELPQVLAQLSR